MHRQPRRLNAQARYVRGTRLRADEIRRSRQREQAPEDGANQAAERQPQSQPQPQPEARADAPAEAQERQGAQGQAAPTTQPGQGNSVPPPPRQQVGPQSQTQAPRRAPARIQPQWQRVEAAPPPPARRRRISLKRGLLIGIPLALVLIAGSFVGVLAYQTHHAMNQIFIPAQPHLQVTVNAQGTPVITQDDSQPAAALPDWDKKERVNILLLGVDDRHDGDPARSDTMILISIDPANKTIGMLSIPRDLKVTIPGVGEDKINAAYPNGEASNLTGPGLARATVEYNFHVPVHYVATVDFTGFQKIVDTLGGVTLDVASPIKDDTYPADNYNYTRLIFHTGVQHLDGKSALAYSRTRHDDSDFGRGSRQQQVLMALREQSVSLNLITKAPQLIGNLGDTVRTDLPPNDALALAKLISQIKGDSITSYSLMPDVTEDWPPGGTYYLIPNWTKVNATVSQMMGGSLAGAASASPAPGQGQGQASPGLTGGTPASPTPTPTPNYTASIQVLNATRVNRLAANSAVVLNGAGFSNVTAAQASQVGPRTKSQVTAYSGNLATAQRVAEALGLPRSTVKQGDPGGGNGFDVVVILGDDAPVPPAGP